MTGLSGRYMRKRSTKNLNRRSILIRLGIGCLFLCTTVPGCGKKEVRLPVFKVTGKVIRQGEPLQQVTVVFHGKKGLETTEGFIRPRGITDANGVFSLTTYVADDGAAEGEYEVSFEQWINDNPDKGPSNRLAPELGRPESSGIRATVTAGENSLSPFELP